VVIGLGEDIEIDEALFEVRRSGRAVPMEPQAFDVLLHLVRHSDRVVPKEELMDTIWGGRFRDRDDRGEPDQAGAPGAR
jgi:DNA-binding winged helix-turn-helix (wHTH) protein